MQRREIQQTDILTPSHTISKHRTQQAGPMLPHGRTWSIPSSNFIQFEKKHGAITQRTLEPGKEGSGGFL